MPPAHGGVIFKRTAEPGNSTSTFFQIPFDICKFKSDNKHRRQQKGVRPMKKYQIVNARVDQCSGGPDAAILVGEVGLKSGRGKPFFFTLIECDGMPMIFKTKESVFDWWMDPDSHSDELDKLQAAGSLYDSEDYSEFFEKHDDIDCYDGLRYLIYLIRASWDDTESFIAQTKGKNLDEIEIPKSDVEEEWEEGDKG